jgi:hypothetical protein
MQLVTVKLLYIFICSAMAIAESSKEVGYGEEAVLVSPPNLSHSNSANSFRNEKLGCNSF